MDAGMHEQGALALLWKKSKVLIRFNYNILVHRRIKIVAKSHVSPTQNDRGWGSAGGAYSAPQTTYLDLREPLRSGEGRAEWRERDESEGGKMRWKWKKGRIWEEVMEKKGMGRLFPLARIPEGVRTCNPVAQQTNRILLHVYCVTKELNKQHIISSTVMH